MVDMRRTDADKAKDSPMGMIAPQMSDLPDYDYGLNISFNGETLEKLDLDSDVHVGDFEQFPYSFKAFLTGGIMMEFKYLNEKKAISSQSKYL